MVIIEKGVSSPCLRLLAAKLLLMAYLGIWGSAVGMDWRANCVISYGYKYSNLRERQTESEVGRSPRRTDRHRQVIRASYCHTL